MGPGAAQGLRPAGSPAGRDDRGAAPGAAASIDHWWPTDWPAFVARQRAQCVSEQRAVGLPARGQTRFPGFLDAVALPSGPPVLLHTEVMRQHLLATEGPGGAWRLSGLIDFEPAMRGEREYEFVAVGVFTAAGDARFLTRTLTGYGYHRDQLGPRLRRRLLAWAILHRYGSLAGGCGGCPNRPSPPRRAGRYLVRHRLTVRRLGGFRQPRGPLLSFAINPSTRPRNPR